MKVAILSDIHGNIVALRAVFQQIKTYNVQRIYVLGDMVGYYYHPKDVLRLLCSVKSKICCVQGNHERMLSDVMSKNKLLESVEEKHGHGLSVAMEELSIEEKKELCRMPTSIHDCLDRIKITFCHGSFYEPDLYLYPSTSIDTLRFYENSGRNFIFMGHTHRAFIYPGKTVLVNVGSVGQARDYGGLASWCLFDTSNQTVIFQHTPYDVEAVISEVRKFDPNHKYLWEILSRGK